jgi:WS/DGAT/MGAT family acyltransferase
MSYFHYDRLSALDASFLDMEDPNSHMHIGSLAIFDAGPLQTEDGGLDFERIFEFVDVALRRNARFRQKVARVPLLGHPVWVDDETFNLSYHLRHSCLPTPGSLRLLKRLAGRIMSQQLDRGKPLWEMWIVEGIEGNRFAVILKVHHCMADGVSGFDLLSAFMGPDASYRPPPAGHWVPRPAPAGRQMLTGELVHRARAPLALLGAGLRALSEASAPVETAREVAQPRSCGRPWAPESTRRPKRPSTWISGPTAASTGLASTWRLPVR